MIEKMIYRHRLETLGKPTREAEEFDWIYKKNHRLESFVQQQDKPPQTTVLEFVSAIDDGDI